MSFSSEPLRHLAAQSEQKGGNNKEAPDGSCKVKVKAKVKVATLRQGWTAVVNC